MLSEAKHPSPWRRRHGEDCFASLSMTRRRGNAIEEQPRLSTEAAAEPTGGTDALSASAERHWRFNFVVMAADFTWYSLALAFASTSTVLPAFVQRLGAPNIVIGAMPAIATLGYALPPLLVANYIERLPRKLPYILKTGLAERLTYLVFALTAFFLAANHPEIALPVTMATLVAFTLLGGSLCRPGWTCSAR